MDTSSPIKIRKAVINFASSQKKPSTGSVSKYFPFILSILSLARFGTKSKRGLPCTPSPNRDINISVITARNGSSHDRCWAATPPRCIVGSQLPTFILAYDEQSGRRTGRCMASPRPSTRLWKQKCWTPWPTQPSNRPEIARLHLNEKQRQGCKEKRRTLHLSPFQLKLSYETN